MEHDPLLGRLRNWLGFSTSDGSEEDAFDSWSHQQVLEGVSAFLLHHCLPVNNETLTFAHDLITDADSRLSDLVNRRLRDNEPISRQWINEVRGKAADDDARIMSTLRQRLEKSITDFTQTTKDARTATTDYKSALASHVDELDEVQHAGAVIQELAMVAKAMLDRTQEIEAQMVRSEHETKNLHRRLDEARRNAEMDHLTGLPNRRAFESLLDSEFSSARLSHDQLCVAFCDIDKFKLINDVHGHEAGDRVLKLVATTLSEISDDRCHVEVAGVGGGRADLHRTVGQLDVQRVGVGSRVDGDRLDVELVERADHAHRDLATVGDEHALEHRRQSAGGPPTKTHTGSRSPRAMAVAWCTPRPRWIW